MHNVGPPGYVSPLPHTRAATVLSWAAWIWKLMKGVSLTTGTN